MSQSLPHSPSRSRAATRTAPRRRIIRRRWLALAVLTVLAALLVLPRLFFVAAYRGDIYQTAAAPQAPVAIVFGAGIRPDGSATPVLYDRVATAAGLFRQGRVSRLLLSGDGQAEGHDEPGAMRTVALALGVPDSALLLDRGGIRTYESCNRARAVYGVERAVLVTQDFHLPRAMYLCDRLGVTVTGVATPSGGYHWKLRAGWQAREVLASASAWWDVNVLQPR